MFAAIEIKQGEGDHDAIKVFFSHADSLGLKFKLLEPYSRMTVGLSNFLRFKTDCTGMEALIPFLQEENRSVILPANDGYQLHTQTTKGKVPLTTMQSSKLPNFQRKYRGTLDKFWKRQFS